MREVLVYIHGVSTTEYGARHDSEYDALHEGVLHYLPQNSAWREAAVCKIEWGWNYDSNSEPLAHRLLSQAQTLFGQRVLAAVREATDHTLNPGRWVVDLFRPLMLAGFSDMFYYVSRDGKNSVRASVARQIVDYLKALLEPGEPVSLTLIGHSAGSVIAFDLSFFLYYTSRHVFVEKGHQQVRRRTTAPSFATVPRFRRAVGSASEIDETQAYGEGAPPLAHEPDQEPAGSNEREYLGQSSLSGSSWASDDVETLNYLRDLVAAGKLRLRRMLTFGSPVAMLACRSNNVLRILANGNRLEMRYHGLDRNPPLFGPALKGPRWLNYWDKDDPIAFPVEPLMEEGTQLVRDIYVDVSDSVTMAHNAYWNSAAMHEAIAQAW